jgi:hypothetical protein
MCADSRQGILRLRAAGIAALCVGAMGGLAAPPTAGGAPGCQEWKLQENVLSMTMSDGSRATFEWDPGSQQPISGDLMSGGTFWSDSYISGKAEGGTVAFTVAWKEEAGDFDGNPSTSNIYTDGFKGKVNPDGQVTGTRLDSKNNSTTWLADQRFTCTKQAEDSKPPLVPDNPVRDQKTPKEADVPQNPAEQTSTITGDVELYDVPGGEGTYLGDVTGGRKVKVLKRQDDNWVQISGTGVPNHDTGWVWGDFVKP